MIASESTARLLLNMPPGLEICGRFFWQAQELLGENFMLLGSDNIKRDAFTNALLDTMIKCHSMEYHLGNFKELERQHISLIESNKGGITHAHNLLFEFEAFLFQLKSALDIGTKIIGILIPNRFKTKTFAQKGEHLERGLEQYERDHSAKPELPKALREMLKADREKWLEQAINLRDTISHYRTFADFKYQIVTTQNEKTVQKPTFSGLTPIEYMELSYRNCLEFLQDFICLSIGLALPSCFSICTNSTSPCRVGEPLASYIKFRLASIKASV